MELRITPKQVLFETAARLFYRRGYRATGVDMIAAESGIGKMTLYRHYPSKNDLIVAYLQYSDRVFWEHYERITGDVPAAHGKLLVFFDSLQQHVTSSACYGCPFLNIAAEYPESDYPGHQVAFEHKEAVLARFRQLAHQAGACQPDVLADALLMLMDGAYVAARLFGSSPRSPAVHLAEAARQMIAAQCADSQSGRIVGREAGHDDQQDTDQPARSGTKC
jgi:AcrR family transcriptional regulator